MKLRKSNRMLWCSLGLALVLTVGALACSAGTAYGRYRASRTISIPFTVRSPEPVYLGAWEAQEDGTKVFVTSNTISSWMVTAGSSTLDFTAANGTGETDYLAADRQVRVRLVASLGLAGSDATLPKVTLTVPQEIAAKTEDPQESTKSTETAGETILEDVSWEAAASPITEGSALYKTFGPGWIFTFHEKEQITVDGTVQDIQGKELYWTLTGGKFSTLDMKLTIENAQVSTESIVNLQVIGE